MDRAGGGKGNLDGSDPDCRLRCREADGKCQNIDTCTKRCRHCDYCGDHHCHSDDCSTEATNRLYFEPKTPDNIWHDDLSNYDSVVFTHAIDDEEGWYFVVDSSGVVLDSRRCPGDLTGYEDDQIRGCSLYDFIIIDPSEPRLFEQQHNRGQPVFGEFHFMARNGALLPSSYTALPTIHKTSFAVVGFMFLVVVSKAVNALGSGRETS